MPIDVVAVAVVVVVVVVVVVACILFPAFRTWVPINPLFMRSAGPACVNPGLLVLLAHSPPKMSENTLLLTTWFVCKCEYT